MHAVMMTSTPPLLYWAPASVQIMKAVPAWRAQGTPAFYTLDAGPNVHVLCPFAYKDQLARKLSEIPGVQRVITALPGGPTRLIETP